MFGPLKVENPIEQTLKSLINFKLKNNINIPYSELIELVLQDNRLERVSSTVRPTVFGAISLALFHTDSKYMEVIDAAREYLMRLVSTGEFPFRLYELKNNRLLMSQLLEQDFIAKENYKYFFDLISLAFQVKVVICSVPPYNQILNEIYYTNGFLNQRIMLFKNHKGEFDCLYKEGEYEKHIICRELLNDRLNLVLSLNSDSDKKPQNNKGDSPTRKRHRRSLSDSTFERFFAYASRF